MNVSRPEPGARASLAAVIRQDLTAIARTFENHMVDTGRWHRELMLKMFLEIPGLRPAVLHETSRSLLSELRSFRHVFRHSYDYQLDVEKLNRLVEQWQQGGSEVIQALTRFVDWLCGGARRARGRGTTKGRTVFR
jgi:hypothetical protein